MFRLIGKILVIVLFLSVLLLNCKSNEYKNEVKEFKGYVEVSIEDFKGDGVNYNLSINGRRYKLVPTNPQTKLNLSKYKTGDFIKIKGINEDNKIYILDILE